MQSYIGRVYVRLLGLGLLLIVFAVTGFSQNMFRKMNDFDGDGKSDFAVVRTDAGSPFNKVWYIWQSRDGFKAFSWGSSGDMVAPGDYDGDDKTDIAIFRPTNQPPLVHYFWIWRSGSNSPSQVGITGIPALAPMQQDFDGDGKTDPATWIGSFIEPPNSTPTNLHLIYSATNNSASFQIPVGTSPGRIGDMTGDGRADVVYGLGNGINIINIATGTSSVVSYPVSGRLVPGDFDGDGKGDVALWRSSDGMWGWVRSSDNTVQLFQWGMNGDVPVTGDYDGDGKTDPAIWRPGSGQSYFWVYGSQNSSVTVLPWGLSTDSVLLP